jgi:hydrogenase expression/formation protein HypC
MCLALPGKIVQLVGRDALIEYPGERRRAFVGDDVQAGVGDYVLVQMGVAVRKLSAQEAATSLKAWRSDSSK